MIVAFNVILMQCISLSRIYTDFFQYSVHSEEDESKLEFQVAWSIYFGLLFSAFTFYSVRFWLLYFDTQLSQATKNRCWRMAIDPNSESKNRYLDPKFQRIFGNDGKYLLIIAFCVALFETILTGLGSIILSQQDYLGIAVWGTLSLFNTLVNGTIWITFKRKLKNYDNFGITKEMQTTVYVGIGTFIINIVTNFGVSYFSTEGELGWIEGFEWIIFMIAFQYLAVPYVIKIQHNDKVIQSLKLKLRKSIEQDKNKKNTKIKLHQQMSKSNSRNSPVFSSSQTPDFPSEATETEIENVSNNDFKHWSQVVSSAYGYELFINHLEREYSCENLLFLTEYLQIKTVLEYKFEIFDQLVQENPKGMGFDLAMPKISQNDLQTEFGSKELNSGSGSGGDHDLPVSMIAKQLFNDSNVIVAFKSLYRKYIDANNAPFMINISSRQRRSLMMSLDNQYYSKTMKRNNNSNNSDGSGIAMIDDEFENNNKSNKWLLTQVVEKMDITAKEITKLMNDSFLRFTNEIS